ncbi:hypothetical protein Hanom_Chr12g01094481 [Helianthus anomalus]
MELKWNGLTCMIGLFSVFISGVLTDAIKDAVSRPLGPDQTSSGAAFLMDHFEGVP